MRLARMCVWLFGWAAAAAGCAPGTISGGSAQDAAIVDLAMSGGGQGGSGGDDLATGQKPPPHDLAMVHDLATAPRDMATPPPPDLGVCQPPNLGTRTAPPFGAPTVTTSGLLVRVMNNCPFALWIRGQGGDGNNGVNTLSPDNLALVKGQEQDYDAKSTFGSARVTAYRDGNLQTISQFIELNYGGGQLGYNVSYVDFLGLPVEVTAACGTTACYAPLATLLDGCPANLKQSDRCVSAGAYCSGGANAGSAFCTALDATAQQALQLSQCKTDLTNWLNQGHNMSQVGSTPAVYACTNFWASSPFCCAVVNRGVVSGDSGDNCSYYKNPPFNTYAQWVHQKCPLIYAFPYDDAAGQSGYHQCAAKEIRITFCPGG